MNQLDVIARVTGYIKDNFLYMRPDVILKSDDSLLENGIIDSMGVMELVSFLEEAFGVRVADDDITEDNFGSVSAITRYVMSTQASNAAA